LIYFQGTLGSYSHQALTAFTEKFSLEEENNGLLESADVIESVFSQDNAFGFLPVENSIVGNVEINTQYLDKEPCHWIAEHYHRIDHCLMASPQNDFSRIKKVHSHPIALAQCRNFLLENNLEGIPCLDTAHSAKELSAHHDETIGVIASSLAAELYGLKILSSNIQNAKDNFTKFIFFCHTKNQILKSFTQNKMTLLFATAHRPGSLLSALEVFARYQINLTKLESKLDPQNPFHYFFTVDLLGDVQETKVNQMLSDLKKHTSSLRIIGRYQQGFLPKL